MKIGPITFRAGLVSNNLVVDYFSYTSVDMLALIGTKRLLNILTIKRADEIREHRRAYMLIALASSVVAPTHVDATKFDRVFGELELQCQLFGVSLLKAGSVDELVSCILAAQDDFYPEMSEADKALFSEYLDDLDGMP
ncbi:hypothetical protein [Aquitalea palustris]|nr:hypothetical protein [Aquitalea palustris]